MKDVDMMELGLYIAITCCILVIIINSFGSETKDYYGKNDFERHISCVESFYNYKRDSELCINKYLNNSSSIYDCKRNLIGTYIDPFYCEDLSAVAYTELYLVGLNETVFEKTLRELEDYS